MNQRHAGWSFQSVEEIAFDGMMGEQVGGNLAAGDPRTLLKMGAFMVGGAGIAAAFGHAPEGGWAGVEEELGFAALGSIGGGEGSTKMSLDGEPSPEGTPSENPQIDETGNEPALNKMTEIYNNKQLLNSNYDCSEIADAIYKASGENGEILEITSPSGEMTVRENGRIQTFVYHQVYSDGKYVYDPRWSGQPVPLEEYISELNNLNNGNITIKTITP